MIVNLKNKLYAITKGYARIFTAAVKIVFVTAVITLIGFIVIYPLWYSALNFKKEYSVTIGILAALVLLFLIVKKLKTGIKSVKQTEKSIVCFFLSKILMSLVVLFSLSILYMAFLQLHYRHYVFSSTAFILFLFISGSVFFKR